MQQIVALNPASAQYVGWFALGLLDVHAHDQVAREPAGQNLGPLEVSASSP